MAMTDTIFAYTRAMAINDGVLINVTDQARVAGLRVPVAFTERCYSALGCDDDTKLLGVLRSIVTAAALVGGERIDLAMQSIGRDWVSCYALIHGGDRREPVITVMLVGED
jgi:hypothetical protein